MIWDRICVLNLRKRPDRLNEVAHELGKWDKGDTPVNIFTAIDGTEQAIPSHWTAGAGAYGCKLSHCAVLREALQDGIRHLLVLEDDIILRQGFTKKLEEFLARVPDDYAGFMLGGQHHFLPKKISSGIVRCWNTQRTHAYSANRGYMKDLLALWQSPELGDHIDHVVGQAQKLHKIYAPDPFLIGQRRSRSDVSLQTPDTQYWIKPSGEEKIVISPHGKAKTDPRQSLFDFLWYAQEEALNSETVCMVSGLTKKEITKVWQGEVHELSA